MFRLIAAVAESRRARVFGVYVVVQGLQKASAVLLIPIATRYMSTDEYGLLASCISTSSLFVLATFLCTNEPLYLEAVRDDSNVDRLGAATVTLQLGLLGLGMAVVGAMALVFGSSTLFGAPVVPHLTLALLGGLLGIFGATYLPFLQARDRAREFALLGLGASFVPVAITLLLLHFGGMQSLAFLIGTLCGNALTAGYVVFRLLRPCGPVLDRGLIRNMLSVCVPLVPHNLAFWLRASLDRLLVTAVAGTGAAGLLHLASQVASALQLGIEAFRSAYNPRLYRGLHQIPVPGSIFQGLPASVGAFAFAGLVLGLGAPELFALAVGPEFHSAHRLVPFFCSGALLVLTYYQLATVLFAHRRTRPLAVTTLVMGTVSAAGTALLVRFFGLDGAAVGAVLANLLMVLGVHFSAQRIQPLPWPLGRTVGLASLPLLAVLATSPLERLATLGAGTLLLLLLAGRDWRRLLSALSPERP